MNGKKTETASFRLEKSQLDELRRDSESKFISLNTLVSQIFSDHINWHANSQKTGLIPFPKKLLIRLMNKLTDEEVVQLGYFIANNETKDIVMMLQNEHNPITFLNVFGTWMKITGFPHTQEINGTRYRCQLQHEMGKKWSLYFDTVMKKIFENLGINNLESEITANSYMLKVDLEKKILSKEATF